MEQIRLSDLLQKRPPPHPGYILVEYFINRLRITGHYIHVRTGIQLIDVAYITRSMIPINQRHAERLATYLGDSAEWWMEIQRTYENWVFEQYQQEKPRKRPR
ncbi:MAG: hypothetical protein JNK86_06540 [Alphaproteobacteria bacterium]|nr:hypothetical protein [Alphaproteobacteria bacterium]